MYAYVLNNPMTNIDPTGQNCFDSGIFYQVTTSMGTGTDEASCDFSDMLDFTWDYALEWSEGNSQALTPIEFAGPPDGSVFAASPSGGCAVLTASCSVTVTATVGCPMTELLCQAEYATLQPALQDNSGCRFFLQNPCGSPPQTQQKSQAPKTPSPAPNNNNQQSQTTSSNPSNFSKKTCFYLDWGSGYVSGLAIFTAFQPEAVVVSGPLGIVAGAGWVIGKIGGC
jgi:hypothetical protein